MERVVEQEKPDVVESIVPEAAPEAVPEAELDDTPYYSQIEALVISVVDELGGGHSESTYRNAMQVGLRQEGIQHESERSLSIEFRGEYVGLVRADLVVEKSLVIELKILGNDEGKTVETTLTKAQEQCRIYMRKTGIIHGLVIGFPDREGKKAIIRAVS
jgi:GxxExxY protein